MHYHSFWGILERVIHSFVYETMLHGVEFSFFGRGGGGIFYPWHISAFKKLGFEAVKISDLRIMNLCTNYPRYPIRALMSVLVDNMNRALTSSLKGFKGEKGILGFHGETTILSPQHSWVQCQVTLKNTSSLCWHSKGLWGKATGHRAHRPHRSILGEKRRSIQETPQHTPHTLAQGYSGCSGAGLLQFWFWKTFTEYF